jgi:hypothetical protein
MGPQQSWIAGVSVEWWRWMIGPALRSARIRGRTWLTNMRLRRKTICTRGFCIRRGCGIITALQHRCPHEQGTSMGTPNAIYFCVGDRATKICSYAWRVGWGRTSFYLKAQYRALTELKVSLHGPSKEHTKPGFKVDLDQTATRKAISSGGYFVATPGWLPHWFKGHPVEGGATHVVRFRTTWDFFEVGVPSAPSPDDIKPSDFAYLVPPPPHSSAVDVDIFVSDSGPYWPNERQARLDNACLGPLQNEAHQYLTAVAVRRQIPASPTPPGALAPTSKGPADRVRGVGATVDEHGILWICEQWMSRTQLVELGER